MGNFVLVHFQLKKSGQSGDKWAFEAFEAFARPPEGSLPLSCHIIWARHTTSPCIIGHCWWLATWQGGSWSRHLVVSMPADCCRQPARAPATAAEVFPVAASSRSFPSNAKLAPGRLWVSV